MTEAEHAEFVTWLSDRGSDSLVMTLVGILFMLGTTAATMAWAYSKGVKASGSF